MFPFDPKDRRISITDQARQSVLCLPDGLPIPAAGAPWLCSHFNTLCAQMRLVPKRLAIAPQAFIKRTGGAGNLVENRADWNLCDRHIAPIFVGSGIERRLIFEGILLIS